MSKRGLPSGINMRHDSHYVEELSRANRSVGKIIPIGQIEPNPQQPRTEIGDLTELAGSIRQNGVLEPLLVKPNRNGTYMIIAGERRWRAAGLAGLREVPCVEMDLDEKTVAEIALIENLQRKDLTVWEEADGLAALSEKFGYTHEDIAKKISKSRTTVTELLSIAGLPPKIRERARAAGVNAKSSLLEIARQFDEAAMEQFLERVASGRLSRDEIRRAARPAAGGAAKPALKSPGQPDRDASAATFSFRGPAADFELKIKFTRTAELEKTAVLRALKAAFDDVKKNGLRR